jgi:hypothetical protein
MSSVVCLFVWCADNIVLEDAKSLLMGFGHSKIWKYRNIFKFILRDAAILDILQDLNCLSQEEFFTK